MHRFPINDTTMSLWIAGWFLLVLALWAAQRRQPVTLGLALFGACVLLGATAPITIALLNLLTGGWLLGGLP